jgi:hypothetical protein
MQELIDGGDSRERAGTRIWTAVEALLKAQYSIQDMNLAIDKWIGDGVLFRTDKAPHRVITFPVKMTRGQERLVAMVVQTESLRCYPAGGSNPRLIAEVG